jgi:Fe-S-cluster containining protein
MSNEPWYHEGLRFECIPGCGRCCTGEPGYVWVTQEEIEALANAGGVEVAQFEESFVRQVGTRKSLVEKPNGDCVFYDSSEHRCLIYVLRPRQCCTYPFWVSNLKTPEAWQDACHACPGCGQGQLIPLGEIQARARVIRV